MALILVPTKDVDIGCFAYGSLVRTKNRGTLAIEDVRTGDLVESITLEGELTYSDVVMLMHQVY